jgi:hypothetical protein
MSLPKPSLPIPNLDDRRFDDLMKEAATLIPIYDREWTNHNPSDPGITLLELFAWLSEMLIYRINKVPEENYRKFLSLIRIGCLFTWDELQKKEYKRLIEFLQENYGANWARTATVKLDEKTIKVFAENNSFVIYLNEQEHKVTITNEICHTDEFELKTENSELRIYDSIEKDIERGLRSISRRYRAITSDDYEFLAKECMDSLKKDLAGRAICAVNRDLVYGSPDDEKPGHVSVVIIPKCQGYEFCWEDILGKDNFKMREFLLILYGADWIKEAAFGDTDGGKTIIVSKDAYAIELKLNEIENKVTIKSEGGIYELNVKKENEKSYIFAYCRNDGKPSDLLRELVKKYLDKRKLITTNVHVAAPDYQQVKIEVLLVLKENTDEKTVTTKAHAGIRKYFDPITGGADGSGWHQGRYLYRSEIYSLCEGIQGVDHVAELKINGDPFLQSAPVKAHQLILLDLEPVTIIKKDAGG